MLLAHRNRNMMRLAHSASDLCYRKPIEQRLCVYALHCALLISPREYSTSLR